MHPTRLTWPRSARLTVTLLTLLAFVLICALVANRKGQNTAQPAATAAPSDPFMNPAALPVPSNLYSSAYEGSEPIRNLKVGQTRFTTIGEPEAAPNQMVPLAYDADTDLCLNSTARMWREPGDQVGDYAQVNAAVRRVSVAAYEFIVSPSMAPVSMQAKVFTDHGCLPNSTVTIRSDAKSRQVLGLIDDLKPGQNAWVPANTVWVADDAAKRGYLLAMTSRSTSFAGAAHISVRPNGTIETDGPKFLFEKVGQGQISLYDTYKDVPPVVIV